VGVAVQDQVDRLIAAGVPDAAGLRAVELAAHAAALPTLPGAVLAVHHDLAPPSRLAGLLRLGGRAGFVVEDMTDVDQFAPVEGLACRTCRSTW
jgi:hypothetical protein